AAAADHTLQSFFDRRTRCRQSDQKARFGLWRNDVQRDSAFDNANIYSGLAKKLVTRKFRMANVFENVQERFDRRITYFRIRRMRRLSGRFDLQSKRTF